MRSREREKVATCSWLPDFVWPPSLKREMGRVETNGASSWLMISMLRIQN